MVRIGVAGLRVDADHLPREHVARAAAREVTVAMGVTGTLRAHDRKLMGVSARDRIRRHFLSLRIDHVAQYAINASAE
jgi:hypothetical protein